MSDNPPPQPTSGGGGGGGGGGPVDEAITSISGDISSIRDFIVRPPERADMAEPETVAESRALVGGLRTSLLRVTLAFTPVTGKWNGKQLTEIAWGSKTVDGRKIKAIFSDGTASGPVEISGKAATLSSTSKPLDIVRLELSVCGQACLTTGGPIPYQPPATVIEGTL